LPRKKAKNIRGHFFPHPVLIIYRKHIALLLVKSF